MNKVDDMLSQARGALEGRTCLPYGWEREAAVRRYVTERLAREPALWQGRPTHMLRVYKDWQDIGQLVGATITGVDAKGPPGAPEHLDLRITTDRGSFLMWHEQDCCESVWLADGLDDLRALVGSRVVHASERTESGDSDWGTYTWTFYLIRTHKGDATLRWVGESNGYYSEGVTFARVVE